MMYIRLVFAVILIGKLLLIHDSRSMALPDLLAWRGCICYWHAEERVPAAVIDSEGVYSMGVRPRTCKRAEWL
jgi:hypothetical protein